MTRYLTLMDVYRNLDNITLGLVMVSAWAAGFGHLLDVITKRFQRILIPIYWGLIVLAFVGGMIFILVKFS